MFYPSDMRRSLLHAPVAASDNMSYRKGVYRRHYDLTEYHAVKRATLLFYSLARKTPTSTIRESKESTGTDNPRLSSRAGSNCRGSDVTILRLNLVVWRLVLQ